MAKRVATGIYCSDGGDHRCEPPHYATKCRKCGVEFRRCNVYGTQGVVALMRDEHEKTCAGKAKKRGR